VSQHEQTGKFMVIVLLTSGRETKHEYDGPLEPGESQRMASRIIDALEKRKSLPLILENPLAVYNPDAIASIQFDIVTAEQREEFGKQMNRRIGYHPKDVE